MTAIYRPRGLMVILYMLIILGIAGLVASVVNAQVSVNTKRDASIQTHQILREIREQDFDLCQRAERIARQAGLRDEPCKVPAPIASP